MTKPATTHASRRRAARSATRSFATRSASEGSRRTVTVCQKKPVSASGVTRAPTAFETEVANPCATRLPASRTVPATAETRTMAGESQGGTRADCTRGKCQANCQDSSG